MLEFLNSCAISFDLPILEWIQLHMTNGFLDVVMPIITLLGDGGIFWILCAVGLMFFPKYRKAGMAMILALLMGVIICNAIMKPLIGRPRPDDFIEANGIIAHLPSPYEHQHDKSFPSGHTIASFEASVALLLFNWQLGIPAVILAVLISFSRLYLYYHYPTDVLFSVVFGTLFAIIAWLIVRKIKLPERKKKGKYERDKHAA